ncbi:50S ribosomal protein L22 [Candidatus Wolfebacteria bacterium]|nr:50S ribosomal protein L22 [Candidatus Wolfebacteria bacterium]
MEKIATAKLNYLKMAPRKVRLMANVLKGLSVNEAQAQLMVNPKRPIEPLIKLLHSAIANAKNKNLTVENLFIKDIRVNQGPMIKRFMPRAQGRAAMIQKKMSHVVLVLGESEKLKKSRFTIVKAERIKKSEAKKIKQTAKQAAEIIKEKPKPEFDEKKTKPAEGRGFMKRMFRRKSI